MFGRCRRSAVFKNVSLRRDTPTGVHVIHWLEAVPVVRV